MIERIIDKKILPLIIFFILFFKKENEIPKNIKKILVIRLWSLGESILTLPMLKELRKHYPHAEITVLCTKSNEAVFKNQKFINIIKSIWTPHIVPFIFSNFKKYDVAIDTEPHFNISAILAFFLSKYSVGYSHSLRSKLYDFHVDYNDKQHIVFTICDLLKYAGLSPRPKKLVPLKWTKEDEKMKINIRKLKRPIIGIHPGSSGRAPWREWPEKNFIDLINKINKNYSATVIITGTKNEKEKLNRIFKNIDDKKRVYLISDITKQSLFYLISNYDIMISNDTGPMHVAAAQGITTIGLFGPNTPIRFAPFPPHKHIVIYHEQGREPLINVHKNEYRMPPDGLKLMEKITVEEVYEKILKYLKNQNKHLYKFLILL